MALLHPCIYQCICHIVMVTWRLSPYGASICQKEALFATEVVHYRLEMILEMECA